MNTDQTPSPKESAAANHKTKGGCQQDDCSDLLDIDVIEVDDGDWEVWIAGVGHGAIIGMGSTEQEAKDDAVTRAQWLIENIHKPNTQAQATRPDNT